MKKNEVVPSQTCGAKTKTGKVCEAQSMKNGRCHLHGGLSTGAKTVEGRTRSQKSNWKHGKYSSGVREERKLVQSLTQSFASLRAKIDKS
jgi:hypothetical protein